MIIQDIHRGIQMTWKTMFCLHSWQFRDGVNRQISSLQQISGWKRYKDSFLIDSSVKQVLHIITFSIIFLLNSHLFEKTFIEAVHENNDVFNQILFSGIYVFPWNLSVKQIYITVTHSIRLAMTFLTFMKILLKLFNINQYMYHIVYKKNTKRNSIGYVSDVIGMLNNRTFMW